MKNPYSSLFLLVGSVWLNTHVFAQQNKPVAANEVPNTVREAYETESASTPKKWEMRTNKNGQVHYFAFFTDANFNVRLVIAQNGTKIRRVMVGQGGGAFNQDCQGKAAKQSAGAKIVAQEQVFVFASEKIFYRHIFEKDGKRKIVLTDDACNLVDDLDEED
jgi:hypothetical protein